MFVLKRHLIISIIISLSIIFIIISTYYGHFFSIKNPIYIGVTCPLSGKDRFLGKEMLKGLNLFVENYNRHHNPKIVLNIKDDKNDKSLAMKVASEFALDNKTLIVLGHYFSSTSIFAGKIYKKNGLPAITASATASKVTFENEWYFRTVPNNVFQSHFLAHFVTNNFTGNNILVIYVKNEYGTELADSFIYALKGLNTSVSHIWSIDSDYSETENEFSRITTQLRQMYDSGIIFIATHRSEALKIITSLKYPGSKYTIIGPDSFSSKSFINMFNDYPRERAQPGYYSDNIFTVVSSMHDIQSYKTHSLNKIYQKKYKEKPSSLVSVYYDAIYAASQSIQKSNIQPNDSINIARKKVRDALREYQSFNQSLNGITGNIFFNEQGDVEKSIRMAFYKDQKLFPCYQQFAFSHHRSQINSSIINDHLITINNTVMQKIKVVYAGIEFEKINDLDTKQLTCHIIFYLWLRFSGTFNANHILFTNAIEPITIGAPFYSDQKDKITTHAYVLEGKFKINPKFRWFLLDRHEVQIQFRHQNKNTDQIIFIPDPISKDPFNQDGFFGYQMTDIKLFQSIYKDEDILDPTINNNFSVINASAKVHRDDSFYPLRYCIPILFFLLCLFIYLLLF